MNISSLALLTSSSEASLTLLKHLLLPERTDSDRGSVARSASIRLRFSLPLRAFKYLPDKTLG